MEVSENDIDGVVWLPVWWCRGAHQDVLAGEELVYDYQLAEERAKLACTCKAKHCRGWLN